MSFNRGQYEMMGLPSRQTAQRDLTSHSRLKLRRSKYDLDEQTSEDGSHETAEQKLKRMKRELEEREKGKGSTLPLANKSKSSSSSISSLQQKLKEFDDADEHSSSSEDETESKDVQDQPKSGKATKLKAADLALQKELERVKTEKKIRQQQLEQANAAGRTPTYNPLLDKSTIPASSIQRRWDDDVIFRNQAKSDLEKKEKRLMNDIVRSDTHKDFLKKHIL
jgi:protein CWC15